MSDGSFEAYLKEQREHVERALERAVHDVGSQVPTPIGLAIRDGVMSGGKRLRPVLLATAYAELGGEVSDRVYDLGAAVELIHAYSLMHDDLPCMDDAPLRRGRPTPHMVHGVECTMVAGLVLIPLAAARALDAAGALGCDDSDARRVAALLMGAAGAGGMVGGQALDLQAEGRRLTEDELAALHGLKTGALLAASLEMGAVAAGASQAVLEALRVFGRNVGLAFQVVDDVLDATSSAEELGKQPSDADRDKSTYVVLLGVDGARARGRQLIQLGLDALDSADVAAPRLRSLAHFVRDRQR